MSKGFTIAEIQTSRILMKISKMMLIEYVTKENPAKPFFFFFLIKLFSRNSIEQDANIFDSSKVSTEIFPL